MRTFFLLAILSVTGGLIFAQTIPSHRVEYTVTAAYLESCEMKPMDDCPPVTLTRTSPDDEIIVHFPNGGTYTDVYLYAATAGPVPKSEDVLLHDEKSVTEGPPRLRLTGLPDGKYPCTMMACGLGGRFRIILQTADDGK